MTRYTRRNLMHGAGTVGLALLAGCGRLPGQAQQSARIPRIGYLGVFSDAPGPSTEPFVQGLKDLQYAEGQNILIEWRWAGTDSERIRDLAAELVRLPVDVIVAEGAAIPAAMNATSQIPVVMVGALDPITSGYVASFARPGGNVTGPSAMAVQLTAKRLQLLKDAVPGTRRVAVLWHPTPTTAVAWEEMQAAAPTVGVALQSLPVGDVLDFESAFEAAARERADALFLLPDSFMSYHLARTVELGVQSRLPAMYPRRAYVEAGGLMSYGAFPGDSVRRAAIYVDKILKGARPADLPVEQPNTLDFVLNLKTAQALGLIIPPHVLIQATEVLQ
jgi:putative tryptophan/tyrosine transport system substrate-binding protein